MPSRKTLGAINTVFIRAEYTRQQYQQKYAMKNRKFFIILLLCIVLAVITWSGWLVNMKQTKRNGDLIADALKKYRVQNNALPTNLESLVPQYLNKIPRVERKIPFLTPKNFNYSVYDVIPFSGCFTLNFMHKSDGLTYQYDSRDSEFKYTGIGTEQDYIEEYITFEDINLLSSKILSYYKDSLTYPKALKELIPVYMESFPYDTSARYKPYDVAPNYSAELLKYEFHQPCDTFRGKFRLSFDVVLGKYYFNTFTDRGGWAYDD